MKRITTRRQYQLEHQEQAHLMTWADLKSGQLPELKLLFAVPNGGHRHVAVAQRMKEEGLKAGVPDLVLPVARGGHHCLFVEMKTVNSRPKKGGKGGVTDLQRDWHEALRHQGHRVEVCYGADEAKAVLEDYLLNHDPDL